MNMEDVDIKNSEKFCIVIFFMFFFILPYQLLSIQAEKKTLTPNQVDLIEIQQKYKTYLNQVNSYGKLVNEQFSKVFEILESQNINIPQNNRSQINKLLSAGQNSIGGISSAMVFVVIRIKILYVLLGQGIYKPVADPTEAINLARFLTPTEKIPIIFFPDSYKKTMMLEDAAAPTILVGLGGSLNSGGGVFFDADIVCKNSKYSIVTGFTIRNGGAAIANANVLFFLNRIIHGRGISCSSSSNLPFIIGNTLINNHKINGGGILFSSDKNSISILNTVKNNSASQSGGGVAFFGSNNYFIFNDVKNNHSSQNGGGIGISGSGFAKIGLNKIKNNTCAENGGGIWRSGGGKSEQPLIVWNDIKDNNALKDGGGIAFQNDGYGIVILNDITNNSSGSGGGGIYCQTSSPEILGNKISNNESQKGGGIGLYDSDGYVFANNIKQNLSSNYGGGIFIEKGSPVIITNKIKKNESRSGGGIYIMGFGIPILLNNDIQNNIAVDGGGIGCSNGTLARILGNLIFENSSTQSGGAIFVTGSGTNPAIGENNSTNNNQNVKNSTLARSFSSGSGNVIYNNESMLGGGIYFDQFSNPTINNNLINENRAQNGGGGIYGSSPHGQIQNNQIFYNISSGDGGGLFIIAAHDLFVDNNNFMWNIAGSSAQPNKPNSSSSLRSASGIGGAIYSKDSGNNTWFRENIFKWNVAENGGAIGFEGGSAPQVNNNFITQNFADYYSTGLGMGGGIYISGISALLNENEFRQNVAIHGGGLACDKGAEPVITNCLFEDNIADIDSSNEGIGGAIYAVGEGTSPIIGMPDQGNNFFDNCAAFGGAIGGEDSSNIFIQADTIRANHAAYSGIGNGGGVYFAGSGTRGYIGGNAVTGFGNLFQLNSAGTIGDAGIANGGAIAVEKGAKVEIFGNTINNHNGSTNLGGGIYLNGEGTEAIIGGANDDEIINFPLADYQFGNIIQNNDPASELPCEIPEILWPDNFVPETLVFELDSLPFIPTDTIPTYPDSITYEELAHQLPLAPRLQQPLQRYQRIYHYHLFM